ncbi:unnamed protein product [Cladocopium goreaui]|uniref:DEAD/DEAH box helicase domain-containing protein n=1 Tax=Cladocopium goreaui TaxID=2562237 RepID=A0A9P1FQX7_9DINO|nr:unnamed protein product [Cladocopium goreaui]
MKGNRLVRVEVEVNGKGAHRSAEIGQPHLYFTLRDKPAILERTADIAYPGHIKEEEGTFGYLKELPASCSDAEEKIEVKNAKATKTIVIRADATEEAKQEAEEKAQQAWEDSGRVASWGCEWFHTWKKQVAEAVRHADFIQTMLAEVGREKFMGLVKDSLPTEVAIVKDQEFVFPDGSPSLAIRLRIQHIELLQYMRNLVLSNDLEIKINKALTKWQVRVDKTFFCKAFEDELVNLSDLTDHQKQKLADIKDPDQDWEYFHQFAEKSMREALHLCGQPVPRPLSEPRGLQPDVTGGLAIENMQLQGLPDEWANILMFVWGHQVRWLCLGKAVHPTPEHVQTSMPQGDAFAPLALIMLLIRMPRPGGWQSFICARMRELNWEFRGPWMFAHEDLGHVDLSNPDEAVVKLTEHKVRESWRRVQFALWKKQNRRDRHYLLDVPYEESRVSHARKLFSLTCDSHQRAVMLGSAHSTACYDKMRGHEVREQCAGKTFVAAQCALDKLRSSPDGKILFVAPSIALGLYFVRWLAQSSSNRGQLHKLLWRIVLMEHPYQHFLSLHVDGDRLGWTTLPDSKMRFLLTMIDEAHDIFCTDGNRTFLEEKIEAPRQVLFLSSVSQNSSGAVHFPPAAKEISLTQVVRSTKRIVAGAAAFQASVAEKEQIASLCPAGPPLKAFLFESDAHVFEDYAKHTVSALFHVMRIYAGLSLHKRLALLVPNPHFLERFRDALQRHFLTARLAGRNFKLISFTDSLRILPNIKVEQATHADNAELIVLDTVENAKGLESLIVVCIGLDQRVADQSANQVGRSIIYQAITRAQLQAVIVNQLLRGGWLEFLGVTKFKSDTFNESTAMAETTTAAAEALTKVQLPWKLAVQASQENSLPREDARVQRDAEETGAVPPSKPMSEDQDATTAPQAGDKPGDKLVVEIKDSSVWDADVIDIKEPISQLQFDPRSPTGKAEEVASLEVRKYRLKKSEKPEKPKKLPMQRKLQDVRVLERFIRILQDLGISWGLTVEVEILQIIALRCEI